MATTIKGSSVGKEKKGTTTSPSTSLIKKSSKPSTPTPGSSTEEKTDGKPVPNYLRPTMSSNRDSSRLPKKPTTDPTAQKPDLNRRRSFDRPPPVSQLQKPIASVPGTSEIKHLRSSSFSHKSSIRPASDKTYARTASTLKEGNKTDSTSSKSRTIKKSTLSATTTPTTKKDAKRPTSSSSTKTPPKSMTSDSSIDHDNMAIDHLIIDHDDLVGIESEVQSLPEISEMPDSNQELGDPTITVADLEMKQVEDVADNLAVTHDRKAVDQDLEVKTENHIVETQSEPENVEDLGNDQNLTVEEHNVTVDSDEGDTETQHEEKQETEFAEETKDEEADDGKKETESAEEKEEEAADDGKKETEPAEEKKEESVVVEKEAEKKEDLSEVKDEKVSVSSPANGPAKVQTNSGKKDKQDYNNIIEETSSKLMGGRKNKVLALAGAFETVISLQDTNKN